MKKYFISFATLVISALFFSLLFSGCTTAGPFVTNISSDGKGNLIVEKNTVVFNPWNGTVHNGDRPSTQIIRVQSETPLPEPPPGKH